MIEFDNLKKVSFDNTGENDKDNLEPKSPKDIDKANDTKESLYTHSTFNPLVDQDINNILDNDIETETNTQPNTNTFVSPTTIFDEYEFENFNNLNNESQEENLASDEQTIIINDDFFNQLNFANEHPYTETNTKFVEEVILEDQESDFNDDSQDFDTSSNSDSDSLTSEFSNSLFDEKIKFENNNDEEFGEKSDQDDNLDIIGNESNNVEINHEFDDSKSSYEEFVFDDFSNEISNEDTETLSISNENNHFEQSDSQSEFDEVINEETTPKVDQEQTFYDMNNNLDDLNNNDDENIEFTAQPEQVNESNENQQIIEDKKLKIDNEIIDKKEYIIKNLGRPKTTAELLIEAKQREKAVKTNEANNENEVADNVQENKDQKKDKITQEPIVENQTKPSDNKNVENKSLLEKDRARIEWLRAIEKGTWSANKQDQEDNNSDNTFDIKIAEEE